MDTPPNKNNNFKVHRVTPDRLLEFLQTNDLLAPKSVEDLEKIICHCAGCVTSPLNGLRTSVNNFDNKTGASFISKTLPRVLEWATSPSQLLTLPLSLSPSSSPSLSVPPNPPSSPCVDSFSYSPSEARSFIATIFLCNIRDVACGLDERSVNHFSLFYQGGGVGRARTECLMAYLEKEFREEGDVSPSSLNHERNISFERYYNPTEQFPDWTEEEKEINADLVTIHTQSMELPDTNAFVDFANQDIHIHQIIPSATQEEVLFSCCPEAFISILLYDRIRENEAVVIRNCRRYAEYKGYLYTFEFTKLFSNDKKPVIQDVIVIDALVRAQFRPGVRDLNKCYLGFGKSMKEQENYSISTGGWGCGAFGGDEHHKFTEQVVVASLLGSSIHYSAFHNDQRGREFKTILERMNGKKIKDIVELLLSYKALEEPFKVYINRELLSPSSASSSGGRGKSNLSEIL